MLKDNKIHILFLCTGNASRSQMAEGLTEKFKSDKIVAFSAGIRPSSALSRGAIKIMQEIGIDISENIPKHHNELKGLKFDYVITLCDYAKQFCPDFGESTTILHHPFEDPSALIGTTQEVLNKFRQIRDGIKAFIDTLPESLENQKG